METTLDKRLALLLAHLNIERAHFAGCVNANWKTLATNQPGLIASLVLVCPRSVDPSITATLN